MSKTIQGLACASTQGPVSAKSKGMGAASLCGFAKSVDTNPKSRFAFSLVFTLYCSTTLLNNHRLHNQIARGWFASRDGEKGKEAEGESGMGNGGAGGFGVSVMEITGGEDDGAVRNARGKG